MMPELTGSTRRWAVASDFPQPKGKGANGRGFCRWCHQEVPKGRQTWCGPACLDEYWIRANGQGVRQIVLKRDGGVCSFCGINAELLRRIMYHAARIHFDWPYVKHRTLIRLIRPIGDFQPYYGTYWQPDHIMPVAEGGGMCGLSNYRTLCTPCHIGVTGDQQRRAATAKFDTTRPGQLAQAQQVLVY